MLKTLTVWNFALLEQVNLEFGRGLNVLTGETGAGKSILIDALGAVLGYRLGVDAIRTGCDWLRVEAIFEGERTPELLAVLREQAIPIDDGALIITRQLTRKGKNAILVNGCRITLATLRRLGEWLGDIHGQHESLALLRSAYQFAWLDGSDADIAPQRERYAALYTRWHDKRCVLDERRQHAKELAERRDMLRWQHQEISAAQLQAGEQERLEAEVKRLTHAERITEHIAAAYNLLDGDDCTEGILGELAALEQHLSRVAEFDDSLSAWPTTVADVAGQLRETFYAVRDYRDGLDFDPATLDVMQARLDIIDRLCRKYGGGVGDVLRHGERIAAELADMAEYDDSAAAAEVAALHTQMLAEAAALTALRQRAAQRLAQQVNEQLAALGMPDGRLVLALTSTEPTANGTDALDLTFTANLGEPPKPLAKIASGGELSRLALAIKTVAADVDTSPSCMVFDEIDAGIGGQTAVKVAERIALVARRKQVLCITHLPQIAARADAHYLLTKRTVDGKTTTEVARLGETGRVEAIARMASGNDTSAASLQNAREMLNHGQWSVDNGQC